MSHNVTRRFALISATAAAAGLALGARAAGAEEVVDEAIQQTSHASADVVRFLYIDNKTQEAGVEQSVVVALELGSPVASGKLSVSNLDSGEELAFESTGATEASLLFAFVPAADGTYAVSQLAATLSDGSAHVVDFGDCDASYRTFTVGAVAAEEEVAEELTVTALDESGTSVEAGSVESALATTVASTTPAPTSRSLGAAGGVSARSAVGPANEDGVIVVALDPGHGGNDSGAVGVTGAHEADLNWKISQYCLAELKTYAGVQVVLTHEKNVNNTLEQRVLNAVREGADVVVSQHLNSLNGRTAGAEVWAPSSVDYNHDTHTVGTALGEEILKELKALGLGNRGVRYRMVSGLGEEAYDYADGSTGDYYGIIRYARRAGIPGIIIEHAFIDNSSDYNNFLNSDAKLKNLGVADATGIASYYGLKKAKESDFTAVYDYNYYVSNHSDLASMNREQAFNHFLEYGMKEGRQACASFSPSFYRYNNADLRLKFGSLMAAYYYHYKNSGKAEGRAGTGTAAAVVTLWRLYNPYTGEHFYTSSDSERNVNVYQGWKYEGIGWEAPAEGKKVYRLYNKYVSGGDHHYTLSVEERDSLVKAGWTYESDAATWYSGGDVPLYRQYNPFAATGTHNYTTSIEERDNLVKEGWKDESIAWYGLYKGQQA